MSGKLTRSPLALPSHSPVQSPEHPQMLLCHWHPPTGLQRTPWSKQRDCQCWGSCAIGVCKQNQDLPVQITPQVVTAHRQPLDSYRNTKGSRPWRQPWWYPTQALIWTGRQLPAWGQTRTTTDLVVWGLLGLVRSDHWAQLWRGQL